MDISQSRCPICGKDDNRPQQKFAGPSDRPGDFVILKCNDCGHRFTFPDPGNDLLETLYRAGPFMDSLANIVVENMEQRAQEDQWSIVQEFSEPGILLDIGCGVGTFLSGAKKRGYEGHGLEKCPEFCQFAREKLEVTVKQGEPDDHLYPEEFAEVITLWDVLEHLPDPRRSLRNIRSLMKPEGTLFMAFPNSESVEAERFGAHWCGWWVPLHLHHFSPKTMTELLESEGFKIIEAIYRQEPYVTAMSVRRLLGLDTGDMGAFVAKDENRGYLARRLVKFLPFMGGFIERRALRWSETIEQTCADPEDLAYMTFVAKKV